MFQPKLIFKKNFIYLEAIVIGGFIYEIVSFFTRLDRLALYFDPYEFAFVGLAMDCDHTPCLLLDGDRTRGQLNQSRLRILKIKCFVHIDNACWCGIQILVSIGNQNLKIYFWYYINLNIIYCQMGLTWLSKYELDWTDDILYI